jgi:hypothetical protein
MVVSAAMSLREFVRQRAPLDLQKVQDEVIAWVRQLYVELEVRAETPHVLIKPAPDAVAADTGAIGAIKLPHDVRITRVCVFSHDTLVADPADYAELLIVVGRGDGAVGSVVATFKTNAAGLAFATERRLDVNPDFASVKGGAWLLAYTGKFGAGVAIPALSLVVWTKRL